MERKSQNLEFSQKSGANSEGCLEGRSTNLYTMRPLCASGGDVGISDTMHCNSKSSSYQNLSRSDHSDAEEAHIIRQFQCDVTSILEATNLNFCTKPKKYTNGVGCQLKAELSKYKRELMEYNDATKDLEEKYMKINCELNSMQQKHNRFVAKRKKATNDIEMFSDSSSSSTGSEFSLKRKYTQVFRRGSSGLTMMAPQCNSSNDIISVHSNQVSEEENSYHRRIRKQKQKSSEMCLTSSSPHQVGSGHVCNTKHPQRHAIENKENEPPQIGEVYHGRHQAAGLRDIYKVLKNALDINQKPHTVIKGTDLAELQTTINSLQNEQAEFRTIIQRQQNCLKTYHARCIKAHQIIESQHNEIEKLNSNNQQLETEISSGIDLLRTKIDNKLRDVSHLPQMMREEQAKCEKANNEKRILAERLSALQTESSQLKMKLEELGRRKVMTITRLKTAERDLKIFKNYNTSLKHEKRQLSEELQKAKEHLEGMQNTSKRSLTRQRDQYEKQRRELQKRVFELELKLSRSQNNTTSHIQERDSLIAELQTQLNTLVHNFEVSQKHIRVLRRHIYTMTGGNVQNNNRFRINEAV